MSWPPQPMISLTLLMFNRIAVLFIRPAPPLLNSVFRHFHSPRSRHMLERASPRTGEQREQQSHEQRNFRTHAKQPATRSYAPLPAPGTLSGLDAIPAGRRGPDAGVRYGAVFHGSARGRQHLGNHHSGVGGVIAVHVRRPDDGALPRAAGRP